MMKMIPEEEVKKERKRSGRAKKVQMKPEDSVALLDIIYEIGRGVTLPHKTGAGNSSYIAGHRRINSWLVVEGKRYPLHQSGFLYPDNIEKLMTDIEAGCLTTVARVNADTKTLQKLQERWKKNVVIEQLCDDVKDKTANSYSKYYTRDVERAIFSNGVDESLIKLKAKCLDVLKRIGDAEDKRIQYLDNINPVISRLLTTVKKLPTRCDFTTTYGDGIEITMDSIDERKKCCLMAGDIPPDSIRYIANNTDELVKILENEKRVYSKKIDAIIRLIKGEPIEGDENDTV